MKNEFGFDPKNLVKGEWYTLVHRDKKGRRIQRGFGYAPFVGVKEGKLYFHSNHLTYAVPEKDIVGEGPPAEHYEAVITDD